MQFIQSAPWTNGRDGECDLRRGRVSHRLTAQFSSKTNFFRSPPCVPGAKEVNCAVLTTHRMRHGRGEGGAERRENSDCHRQQQRDYAGKGEGDGMGCEEKAGKGDNV